MDVSRRSVMGGVLGGLVAGVGAAGIGIGAASADGTPARRSGRTREYWLQVDHQHRDVAPTKFDPMMGRAITERTTLDALIFRAFTPGWKSVLPGSKDLGPNTGFPGPVLRAEPGDRMVVHLRNNDTFYNQPHSLHPHGLRYTPENCGAWTSDQALPGSAVAPGETYTYEWDVLESSVGTWPYHDHSVPFHVPGSEGGGGSVTKHGMAMGPAAGTNIPPTMEVGAELGLMGHIVVTEHGETRPDREFYLVLHDLYADDVPNLDGDVDCFNGRAFLGNTPTFRAKVGDRVRWHVIALGTDFHVFHVHGHRWRGPSGRWIDSEMLGPSTSIVVDYVEDNPGLWLYHCHVVDHMMGGMVGYYSVEA